MKFDQTSPPFLLKHPFWFYLRHNPRSIALGLSTLILTNTMDALWPLVLKSTIDGIENKVAMSEITRLAAIFFTMMATMALSRYSWRVGFGYFHTAVGENLRLRVFRRISELSPQFFSHRPTGEIMSVLINDVQSFRQAMGGGLLVFLDGIIILMVVFPIMWKLQPHWTLRAMIFLPFVPVLIWIVTKKIHRASKELQSSFGDLTGHVQETIAGVRLLKGFALEDRRQKSFEKKNRAYEKAGNRLARIDALFGPIMELGVTSGTVIFLFAAQEDLLSGAATIGTFFAFHRYILKTVWPMTALGMGLSQLQKGFGAFDRVANYLEQKPDIQTPGQKSLTTFASLQFQNVGFRYPAQDRWVFRGLNFTLHPGERLGLNGPVGSGKTTLLALLTRQYDPTEGQILLNGAPLSQYSLNDLRRLLTLVPQDVFLFSSTVAQNLSFGAPPDTDLQTIRQISADVDISEEILSWPGGYDAILGERGVNLSGGQKQRLALARGLLRSSPVLLLDDVLSAVDTKTEKNIEQTLRALQKNGGAQIIVSHRTSTLVNCDRVVSLSEGAS